MRVFICVFENFSVAIPMDCISSLSFLTKETDEDTAVKNESEYTYISLFCLFDLPPQQTGYKIILKDHMSYKKIVLLSTPVEDEIEIPNDKIYPIPRTLKNTRFSHFFSGIRFLEDSKPVFILNSKQLNKYIQKEMRLI